MRYEIICLTAVNALDALGMQGKRAVKEMEKKDAFPAGEQQSTAKCYDIPAGCRTVLVIT